MAHTQEPDIGKGGNPEGEFQKAIKQEITKILDQKKSDGSLIEYFLLEKFGLDLAVFMMFENHFSIRFFELKAFVGSRPGGVGFGNQGGEGSQVDLLLLGNQQLGLADQFIRWILVDGVKPKGEGRFAIFDNKQAKNASMGGVSRGKQNNLRVNELMRNPITWDKLSKELEHFLVPAHHDEV